MPQAPAAAQVAANLTLASNQLFRGETISDDDPGASLAVSADLPGGFFAGADVSVAAGGQPPRLISSNQYAGVAVQAGAAALEMGAIHRDYREVYDEDYRRHYTEVFAGVNLRRVRLRAYVSPDYLVDGRNSYYIEANAPIATVAGWKLEAHGGISLIPHDLEEQRPGLLSFEDWSLRASRTIGGFTLGTTLAATNYPVFGPSGKVRFLAQVSRAF